MIDISVKKGKRMKSIVEESLLRNFEMIDPSAAARMVGYEMPDKFSLIITLDDGRKILYDDLLDTTRYLNLYPDSMTEEEIMMEFRYRLRHAMSVRGFNQIRLSEETGIPVSMISRYLTGDNIPSILKVIQIAKALKCSLDELWYT